MSADYPQRVYSTSSEFSKIVNSEEEKNALGDGWSDKITPPKPKLKPGPKPKVLDINQFAAAVLEAVTGEPVGPAPKEETGPAKDPAAVALGRKGGLKGGPARAKKLGKKKLREAAKKAAKARWGNVKD